MIKELFLIVLQLLFVVNQWLTHLFILNRRVHCNQSGCGRDACAVRKDTKIWSSAWVFHFLSGLRCTYEFCQLLTFCQKKAKDLSQLRQNLSNSVIFSSPMKPTSIQQTATQKLHSARFVFSKQWQLFVSDRMDQSSC